MLNWIVLNRTDYLFKMYLALNNLQRLICHKTQQTKPNQTDRLVRLNTPTAPFKRISLPDPIIGPLVGRRWWHWMPGDEHLVAERFIIQILRSIIYWPSTEPSIKRCTCVNKLKNTGSRWTWNQNNTHSFPLLLGPLSLGVEAFRRVYQLVKWNSLAFRIEKFKI